MSKRRPPPEPPDRHENKNTAARIARTNRTSFRRIEAMLAQWPKSPLPCFDGNEMSTVKRRIIKAGGWGLAKRIVKPIPIIGSLFAVGLAGHEIRKKGLVPGVVHVGLDVTPIVGTAKGVLEIFTG